MRAGEISDPAHAMLLFDFDNVRRGALKSQSDVDDLAWAVADFASIAIMPCISGVTEALVRFYGGWLDRGGNLTERAQWLLAACSRIRGRRRGVRLHPTVVLEMGAPPNSRLLGTYRKMNGGRGQKMVDAMIYTDALFFAQEPLARMAVISNDEDLTPGLLVASTHLSPLLWYRPGRSKPAPNDDVLVTSGVVVVDTDPL